jgi:hypothetical protein
MTRFSYSSGAQPSRSHMPAKLFKNSFEGGALFGGRGVLGVERNTTLCLTNFLMPFTVFRCIYA